ncbi:MAG TPA: ABC transporter substrate-binding protein [Thermomicrobiales bacterium]|jgi:multiple sugar transport system substrate-binding protein
MKDGSTIDEVRASIFDRRVTRRGALKFGGGLAAAAAGSRLVLPAYVRAQDTQLPYTANTSLSGEITFWHFWGSQLRRTAIRRAIALFNGTYPDIKVNETFVPFGDIWTKNLAAVAAGSGMPDVIVEDRPSLKDRAKNNVEISLGDLAKRDGVTGEKFWPFTWTEATTTDGVPYGLPYETDIRVIYYNKAAFTDAGLDPNTPPANWDDLWSFSDKLDQKDGNDLTRVGFFPTFGNVGLDQWAWNNGGSWQDAQDNPTMNAAPNVAALDWMKKWADRYGWDNVQSLQSTFGSGNQDGFMTGKVAMIVDIQGYTAVIGYFNPQFQDKDGNNAGYGVAKITPAPGHDPAALSGGFALAIPTGSKNTDQAWEFIKYMAFVGQQSWARDTYAMPTIEEMAKTDPVLQASPNWPLFVEAMGYGRAKEYNPYYPAFTSDLIPPATLAALSGDQTPQQALDDAQQKAVAEVNKNKG